MSKLLESFCVSFWSFLFRGINSTYFSTLPQITMSSQTPQSGAPQQNAASQAPVEVPIVPLPDNDEIEASDETESSFGASDGS